MAERVVVLGGGTGGTIVANSLDPRRFEVTVVSASDAHLFQPGLLYVAFKGARTNLVRDERRLLKGHVRLVVDTVTGVDLGRCLVRTAGGDELGYDRLVIATGIQTDPGGIPGLAEVSERFGDYHSSVAQARKLWAKLDGFEGGTIALGQSTPICKCPPSPVEGVLLADALLRARGIRERTRLVFFTPYPRPYPAEPMNQVVEPILKARGIEVRTFFDVDRIDPATGTITSIEGDELACDLPVVIPPFVGADVAYEPADVLDPSRFVRTDQRTLQVAGTETAFAIGDATTLPTSKSGVGAHLEAKVVVRTLSGSTTTFGGRTHCPFDLGDGTGTFVTGTYEAPVVRAAPSRLKHLMKMGFARAYWLSLSGLLDPVLDAYFALTEPKVPGEARRG